MWKRSRSRLPSRSWIRPRSDPGAPSRLDEPRGPHGLRSGVEVVDLALQRIAAGRQRAGRTEYELPPDRLPALALGSHLGTWTPTPTTPPPPSAPQAPLRPDRGDPCQS